MTKKEDPRVIRTKKCIVQAFTELLSEKSYKKITVTDLAARAGINRKTFYSYYSSIDEMVDMMERDLIEKYRPFLESIRLAGGDFNAYDFFRQFNKMVEIDLPVFSILQKAERLPQLTIALNQIIIDVFINEFGLGEQHKYELFAQFAASGIIAMFARWTVSPAISLEEFTDLTAKIALAGFAAVNS